MPVQGSYTQPQQSLSSSILKIGFVAIIVLIGAMILFGFVWADFDPIEFVINIIGILLMLFLLGLAIKGLVSLIGPKPFSPTDDFRDSIIRLCRKAKPFNVKNLYLRGENMRTYAKWGKIIGLGYLPYVTSKPIRDTKGEIVYERDKENKIIYEKEWSQADKDWVEVPKPKYEHISEKDGDVLIVTRRAPFPLNLFFRGLDIVRCHPKYLSDLIGDIFVKDVNLVPYGEYLYPAKQWQEDIIHIMKENETLAIISTHRNNLDLVSNVTQMSLGSDPTFQKIMMAQSERLSAGPMNQGAGQ